jgi:hypothetical protein
MEMYIYKGMDYNEFKAWTYHRSLEKRKKIIAQKIFGILICAFGIFAQFWMGCIEFCFVSICIIAVGMLFFIEEE